jgi:hypothetical protein
MFSAPKVTCNVSVKEKMKILLTFKIKRIELSLKGLIKELGIKPYVWSFGAYDINPKHMVFIAGVQTDEERDKLRSNQSIQSQMRNLLKKHNWPVEARVHVHFDIESQETVNRENDGNWWYHYK